MSWYDAELWAIGTDDWGNLSSADPVEDMADAHAFIKEQLNGRGIIMSKKQMFTAYPEAFMEFLCES